MGLEDWMKRKEYSSIPEFRGKLSESKSSNPAVYSRVTVYEILQGLSAWKNKNHLTLSLNLIGFRYLSIENLQYQIAGISRHPMGILPSHLRCILSGSWFNTYFLF